MWNPFFNIKEKPRSEWPLVWATLSKRLVEMNPIRKFKQMLVDRLVTKGLEKDTIPSFIRSMRICISTDPKMNHLKVNRQLQFLGWNDIEVDYHTLQLAIACFEAEGIIIGLST